MKLSLKLWLGACLLMHTPIHPWNSGPIQWTRGGVGLKSSATVRPDGLGWKEKTSTPITPRRRLPGDSAPLGVINKAVTRGRKEFHSRGGGGPVHKDQSSSKKKSKKKTQKRKSSGSRSQVPPCRAALEPCTKLGFLNSNPS